MLSSVAMVAIRVQDWKAALQWYTDILGFKAAAVEKDDQFAMLALPDGGAHLALVGGYEVDASAPSRCMPNILVKDLGATTAALKALGVRFADNLHGEDEGYRLITIYDPEGNPLQLFEWIR